MVNQNQPTSGTSKPSLFSYHDYRSYLRDLLQYFRAQKSELNLSKLAEACGVKAPYLSYVIDGKRPLSDKTAEPLMSALALTDEQKSYFRLLRRIADSNDHQERIAALENIQKFRRYRELNPREVEIYKYLTKWYYVAIRELAMLPGFKAEPKWIYSKLAYSVTHEEIESALNFLNKHGFIEIDKKKKVRVPDKKIECDGKVFGVALSSLHQEMLSMASESVVKFNRQQRHIIGQMLPIHQELIPESMQILDDCLKKISKLSDKKDNANAVYYFGFFGFPVAKVDDEK